MSFFRGRKFQLRAVVDGTEMEIIQFGADYELNTIPSGQIVLGLGRDATTLKAHPIHSKINSLRLKRPVKVYCKALPHGQDLPPPGDGPSAEDPPDNEEVLLFDGYTTGGAYQRGTAGAGYSISMEGWLADLAYSSAISKALHPASPAQLAFPAALQLVTPESGAATAASSNLTGASLASTVLNVPVGDDLWQKGIKKWFELLCEQDHLISQGSLIGQQVGSSGPNSVALEAIKRMDTGALLSPGLKIDTGGAGAALEHIDKNIKRIIAEETLESVAGHTLWDNLINLGSNFMFAVVPGVEKAAVVPFLPILREPYKTIYANEYDDAQLSGAMPRVLRAVGLFGSKEWAGGPPIDATTAYKEIGIGGIYEAPDTKGGLVLLKQAPLWLAGVAPEVYLEGAVGPPIIPVAPAPAGGGDPAKAPVRDVLKGLNAAINRFARAMYGMQVLAGRQGTLSGKFRTDIAPGSIVRIETAGEKFIGADDQFGQELFACVTRVSLFVTSEGQKASTTFALAHCRGKDENNADQTSMAAHPLYSTKWIGGPLRK
jgi:hypothetical protein